MLKEKNMGIIDHAKDIAKLIKKYNDAELYQKIIDLHDEIFELRENNLKLKEKIKELKEEKKINKKIVFESPFYCQKCYDDNKKLIRLQDLKNGYWECLVCKSGVADPSLRNWD
jgi:ribosomal protein L37AE/L43A